MTDTERDDSLPLRKAIREAKNRAADRTDVVVDLKNAERARLELLGTVVRPLLDEIDEADDRFDFALSSGETMRLWIDMVAFVAMGRDKRTYRLLRDTRAGRIVLSEAADLDDARQAVTEYVAARIVERERMLDVDSLEAYETPPVELKIEEPAHERERGETAQSANEGVKEFAIAPDQSRRARRVLWFVIGMVAGAFVLAASLLLGSPGAL